MAQGQTASTVTAGLRLVGSGLDVLFFGPRNEVLPRPRPRIGLNPNSARPFSAEIVSMGSESSFSFQSSTRDPFVVGGTSFSRERGLMQRDGESPD